MSGRLSSVSQLSTERTYGASDLRFKSPKETALYGKNDPKLNMLGDWVYFSGELFHHHFPKDGDGRFSSDSPRSLGMVPVSWFSDSMQT